jgi:hypothetical protein
VEPNVIVEGVARTSLVFALLAACGAAPAAQCLATSAERRVPLLELYTSEGCDSCPPTDRWLSSLPGKGLTTRQVVALAFHVDYWNYLGWSDPFSKREYSERQRSASIRNKARLVYTPQLLLDGRDYRRAIFLDDITGRVDTIGREKPAAVIRLEQVAEGNTALLVRGEVVVPDAAQRADARTYVALYENRLSTQVTGGENGGKRLEHDFVVRELSPLRSAGPDRNLEFQHRFSLDERWKRGDLHIAAFVQNERSGKTLQALAAPICR